MLGAKDLQIAVQWKFDFLEYGRSCFPQPGIVFADVGGKMDSGIIDHHLKDGSPYESTVSAIIHQPHFVLNHLLGPLNETFYRGLEIKNKELTFTFTTHKNPDWDGVASFYLCNYLIQNGALPPERIVQALGAATDSIDQGRVKMEGQTDRPYMLYTMMSHYDERNWSGLMQRGAMLIEDVIAFYGNKLNQWSFLDPFNHPEKYSKEREDLARDRGVFAQDLADSFSFKVFVPSQQETLEQVDVIAFNHQPKSKLTKFWVREETEYKILVYPYEEKDGTFNRAVISVDPGSGFLLPCLGYDLERAEAEKRAKLGKARTGRPRFEKEYCDNEDPWYDGRNHGFTIIDSPSKGTVLAYDEIIGILKSLYGTQDFKGDWKKPLDAFISYRRSGGTEIAWSIKTLLERKGKKVFLDYESLKSGTFNTQLLEGIKKSKCLILILAPGTLDRCRDENDWVAREIREAMARKIKILPLIKDGFDDKEMRNLPDDLQRLANLQRVTLNYEFFHAAIEKINNYIDES